MIDAITGLVNDMWGVVYYTPDFIDRVFAYFVEMYLYLQIKSYLWSVQFFWGIASVIISDFGINEIVNSAISSLSPVTAGFLSRFGFFEGIPLILNAGVTRFVMDLMRFK